MAKNTLYNKVWEKHRIGKLPSGQTQLFIGRHYQYIQHVAATGSAQMGM